MACNCTCTCTCDSAPKSSPPAEDESFLGSIINALEAAPRAAVESLERNVTDLLSGK